eukprot:771987-Pyramimonas_sp.AAC.1
MTPVICSPDTEHHLVQRLAREEGDAPEILVVVAVHCVVDMHSDLGLPGGYPGWGVSETRSSVGRLIQEVPADLECQ